MRKITFILMQFLFVLPVLAATPEQTVLEMISKMKAKGNFLVMVDYIHWPTAFEQMQKNQEGAAFIASSPEELKKVVSQFIAKPSEVVKQKFMPSVASLPAEQKQMMEGILQQQLAAVDEQVKTKEAELKRAKFEVKGSKVEGQNATVNVEQNLDGKKELWTLNLQQIEGAWYLPIFDPSVMGEQSFNPMALN